jgi:hypothetical protein
MILESRISQWAETNDLCAKGHAGFRKDFRTVNNLFILRTLTEQARFQKKKLYNYFVDFKKTFDIVPRDLLWQVLEGPVVVSAGGTWHQWVDTGMLALHVSSRPGRPTPKIGAHLGV